MLAEYDGGDNDRRILDYLVGETIKKCVTYKDVIHIHTASGFVLVFDRRTGGYQFGVRKPEELELEGLEEETRCDECDPSFGCFDGSRPCSRKASR